MARYIDADKLIEESRLSYCKDCNSYNGVRCSACGFDDAMSYVEDAPTADVEEVVRCEKCKDFESHGNGKAGICRNKKLKPCLRYATDFCSYGERK